MYFKMLLIQICWWTECALIRYIDYNILQIQEHVVKIVIIKQNTSIFYESRKAVIVFLFISFGTFIFTFSENMKIIMANNHTV